MAKFTVRSTFLRHPLAPSLNAPHAGFTITLLEFEKTIPTLWPTVKEFIEENPQYVAPDNAMRYLSEDGGDTYNLCHCEYRYCT